MFMFLSARLKPFVLMILILTAGLISQAQNPTYQLQVSNEVLVNVTTYEFDVYLQRTGTTPLELANVQFGLGFDISVLNGGTPSFGIVVGIPPNSELNAAQQPQSSSIGAVANTQVVGGITYRYVNVAARVNPGAGGGSIISNTGACPTPGNRVGRFRITNSVPFTTGSTMKHIFSTSGASGRTNTLVSAYVGGFAVSINNAASNYGYQTPGTCLQNIVLNAAVPIDLLDFAGHTINTDNLLEWTTATEQNSSHFQMERSFNGRDFTDIGTVAAAGNSTSLKHYQYYDRNIDKLNREFMYYRLRSVDLDNTFKRSSIVKLRYKPGKQTPTILYPDPTKGQITIVIGDNKLIGTNALFYDESGRMVQALKITGLQQVHDISSFPNGVYFIRFQNKEELKVVKL